MSIASNPLPLDATAVAGAIAQGQLKAQAHLTDVLANIARHNPAINGFTAVLEPEALAAAQVVDASHGLEGPLAGVPFAVKNLFDIAGIATIAGSKIHASAPVAERDATAIARLKAAGAILVGALNMDEYAYGFVTENSHYGPTHNPHDLSCIAGGSSGGSAAAVAAGLVPFSLGSDTNGSIRVPAALCGIFGLKPTYGRLSRAGTFPLSSSLDHIGPFARSVRDLALVFDVLQGPDERDPVCCDRPAEPCSPQLQGGIEGLRVAIASGHFQQGAMPQALAAVQRVASALGTTREMEIPKASEARAAAFVMTASEGGQVHLNNLRQRPQDFDPATRDRFLAGALVPNAWYLQAQKFRRWYRDRVRELFETVDVILAPTTPCAATPIGQKAVVIGGEEIAVRPHLGLYTQPISFIGLPVISVPVWFEGEALPYGVQLIGAPYQEVKLLRLAAWLEREGVVCCREVIAGESVFWDSARLGMDS